MSVLPALRYTWRTRPVLATGAVALLGTAFIVWAGEDAEAPLRLRLVGLVLASLLALVWEDATAPVAAATPVGLPALQRERLITLLLAVSAAWTSACLATAATVADARLVAATVEVAALAALLTGLVGLLARGRLGESLAAYPIPLLLVVLVVVIRIPARWRLVTSPDSADWTDAHRRWAGLLVVGLLAVAWAARDPASRPLRRVLRRTARI